MSGTYPWTAFVAVALMFSIGSDSTAQIGGKAAGDARVRNALRQTDLKFETDKDGDYRLLFSFDDDRSHLVIIRSKTVEWGSMEIREVFAIGYKDTNRLSAELMEKLLKENALKKSGAWEMTESGNTKYAVFCVKVAADCDPDALETVVRGVATTADEMEKLILGTDEL